MPYLDDLIRVYGRYTIDQVTHDASIMKDAFGKTLEELAAITEFVTDKAFVEKLKSPIEASPGTYEIADTKLQITNCLMALFNIMLNDQPPTTAVLKMDTLKRLFLVMFADRDKWSVDQRQHVEFVSECLKVWNTYFLSYTNLGANDINPDYKKVIDRLEAGVLKARDRHVDNMVAEAIIEALRKRLLNRRGFYDKEQIKPGDDLKRKIGPAASQVFAFVQLVHLETFDTTRPVNWPHTEYNLFDEHTQAEAKLHARYKEVLDERFIPVLARDKADIEAALPPAHLLSAPFSAWRTRIFADTKYVPLPVTKKAFDEKMNDLKDAVINRTCRIIACVP